MPEDATGEFDVCIVGSGPAGLALALSLGQRGLSVVVLEAGGDRPATSCADDALTIVDGQKHAPLHVATRKGLGGTSSAWGGLCVPYDEIDFDERAWAPDAVWPFSYDEAKSWSFLASHFLQCGQIFEGATLAGLDANALDVAQLGRLARRASMGDVYRERLATSRNILVCLETRATEILVDAARARTIGVAIDGANRKQVLAQRVVLAGGGLRSTGMLLSLARKHPRRLQGESALGRYYMGHLTGEIATIVFNDPRRASAFLYAPDRSGGWAQRRLKAPVAVQHSERLLNTAFTLRPPPLHDPRHADGSLSALALFAAMPGLRDRVKSDRLQRARAAWRSDRQRAHLGNIIRQPAATLRGFGQMWAGTRIENLPLMTLNRSGRYSLRYHAEQAPNASSRVSLDGAAGERLVVDFQFLDMDVVSVLRSHQKLDEGLRQSGLGHLEYHSTEEGGRALVEAQCSDGYHQIGTTRMSHDPRRGVVDAQCRVHGFDNLYVASASAFPSAGSANPTLHIVAMALRLADHIAKQARKGAGAALVRETPAKATERA